MTLLYLLLSIAFGQSCPEDSIRIGPNTIRRLDTKGPTGCYIFSSTNTDLAARRGFRFLKEGQFTIFTEIGNKDGGGSTGFRSYHLLPAGHPQDITSLGGLAVRVKHSSGLDWIFDERGNLNTEQKCKLNINRKVSWDGESTENGKPGGFFIEKCPNTIIIDSGFKRGGNHNENPKAISQVRDSSGKSCSVRNDLMYTFVLTNPGSKKPLYQGKIKSDKDLYTILSRECVSHGMDFSPLNKATGGKKVDNTQ